jgi:hypothetical protein
MVSLKVLKLPLASFSAKAGIQYFQMVLDACLRRHDEIKTFCEEVKQGHQHEFAA